jgi:hypothetical protein
MSEAPPDLQPDTDEVLQAEEPYRPEPSVLVHIDTPVRTTDLPYKAGATRTKANVGLTPVRILTADHRRARAVLMSIGQNMLYSFTGAAAGDPAGAMAQWPANVALTVFGATEVWVASVTGTTSISATTYLWATGEGKP